MEKSAVTEAAKEEVDLGLALSPELEQRLSELLSEESLMLSSAACGSHNANNDIIKWD